MSNKRRRRRHHHGIHEWHRRPAWKPGNGCCIAMNGHYWPGRQTRPKRDVAWSCLSMGCIIARFRTLRLELASTRLVRSLESSFSICNCSFLFILAVVVVVVVAGLGVLPFPQHPVRHRPRRHRKPLPLSRTRKWRSSIATITTKHRQIYSHRRKHEIWSHGNL